MATYLEDKVGVLKLNNESGTVCKLECYYKTDKSGNAEREGKTGSFPLGQSKELELDDCDIPDGAWVTAFANVTAGKDSSGTTWVKYEKKNPTVAEYQISGAINSTSVSFIGIVKEPSYLNEKVAALNLTNDSGTVCSLECYYKTDKNGSPKRAGSTGQFALGQDGTLELDEWNIPNGAWVTAFANVVAGKDSSGNAWVIYEKNSLRIATYTITGVINFTNVAFNEILEDIGVLKGYAVHIDSLPVLGDSLDLDHTYVHAQVIGSDDLIKFGCWGRDDGGKEICSGKGNVGHACKIAGDNGTAGIAYAITGVCHQTSNRILYPAGVIISDAKGYALSSAIYGTYGLSRFKPNVLPCSRDGEDNSYFNAIQKIHARYSDVEWTIQELAAFRYEEFVALYEDRTKKKFNLNKDTVTSILLSTIEEKAVLDEKLENQKLDFSEYTKNINSLGEKVLEKFAVILSEEDYVALFGEPKGKAMRLVRIDD